MRLAMVRNAEQTVPAVLTDDGGYVTFEEAGVAAASLEAFIKSEPSEEEMNRLRQAAAGTGTSLEGTSFAAPFTRPVGDVICLGINYMEHAAEHARFHHEAFDGKREESVYFSKRVYRFTDPGEGIPAHADITQTVDYESELAVILGKKASRVKAAESGAYVFGYTILNDVSARDLQSGHKQWLFGKSLDGFTPLGPVVVTADEFAYPPAQDIRCYINGELRQNSNTVNQIFKIDFVLEELTAGVTLPAGTIIATGTPSGVGLGFTPPKYMKPGDVVRCEIDGIGALENPVVD